jgi:hypothetical protein
MNRETDGWIDQQIDRQMDGRAGKMMGRWIDGQMDRWTNSLLRFNHSREPNLRAFIETHNREH